MVLAYRRALLVLLASRRVAGRCADLAFLCPHGLQPEVGALYFIWDKTRTVPSPSPSSLLKYRTMGSGVAAHRPRGPRRTTLLQVLARVVRGPCSLSLDHLTTGGESAPLPLLDQGLQALVLAAHRPLCRRADYLAPEPHRAAVGAAALAGLRVYGWQFWRRTGPAALVRLRQRRSGA